MAADDAYDELMGPPRMRPNSANRSRRLSNGGIRSSSSFDYDSSPNKRSSSSTIMASMSFERYNRDEPDDEPGRLISSTPVSSRKLSIGRTNSFPREGNSRVVTPSGPPLPPLPPRSLEAPLEDLEKEFAIARSRSSSPPPPPPPSSPPPAKPARDHPWRTGSIEKEPKSIPVESPARNRWAQYETEDLEEESRLATSNAVIDMATRLADQAVESVTLTPVTPEEDGPDQRAERYQQFYHDDPNMSRLEDAGASLPPALPKNSRSTTDYVKGRLSALLHPDHRNSRNSIHRLSKPKEEEESVELEHNKVRLEAMRMLQRAESLESPQGLFRTSGGGFSMRELDDKDTSQIKVKDNKAVSSISGLEKYSTSERYSIPKFDGTFTIGSNDEEDHRIASGESSKERKSWSSRYSVERQLMAITGGLDTNGLLNKMDKMSSEQNKSKSARGMYRASAGAMDGSGSDYSGSFGIWNFLPGTLWSDSMELNYDGTTQSLVRLEKRRMKRKRIMFGSVMLLVVACAVGILAARNNRNKASPVAIGGTDDGIEPVTFYVLSDEPYDFNEIGKLTLDLERLPKDAEFLVHLGNANSDKQSRCQEYGYERAANILKESPVPVFITPGDVDWATCFQKEKALEWWYVNFGQFDKNFEPHQFDVSYQIDRVENFSFLHKGVLFIGVHIVETQTDSTEWTNRHERNVMWTEEQLTEYDPSTFHAIVIFGHAKPSSEQGEYFWPVVDLVKDIKKPVLYLHANSDGSFQQYHPYGEADNFDAVQLEKRGEEAPMKVTIRGGKNPFQFTRRGPNGTIKHMR